MNTQSETINLMAGAIQPPPPLDALIEAEDPGEQHPESNKHVAAVAPHQSGGEAHAEPDAHPEPNPTPTDAPVSAVEDYRDEQPTAAVVNESVNATVYGMPVHDVCNYFPSMDTAALEELAADIAANGLVNPIVMHEGQLVDGRNRLLACRKAGIAPHFIEWREAYRGPMTLARWIWSVNAQRRHMKPEQIAQTYVKMCMWEEEEAARQRRAEGKKRGGETAGRGRPKADSSPTDSSGSNSLTAPGSGDTRARMAKDAGVSQHIMQQAMNIEKADPELGNSVITGEMKASRVAKQIQPMRRRRRTSKHGKDVAGTKKKAAKRKNVTKDKEITFDPEMFIKAAMKSVDEILDTVPDEHRNAVIDEMIETLNRLR